MGTRAKEQHEGENMVVIEVISNKTGEPAKGVRVSLYDKSWVAGGIKSLETNSNGKAEFSYFEPVPNGEISINGKAVYTGKIKTRHRVYI